MASVLEGGFSRPSFPPAPTYEAASSSSDPQLPTLRDSKHDDKQVKQKSSNTNESTPPAHFSEIAEPSSSASNDTAAGESHPTTEEVPYDYEKASIAYAIQHAHSSSTESTQPSFSRRSITDLYANLSAEHVQPTAGVTSSAEPTEAEERADYEYWRLTDAYYQFYRKYVDHHASFGPDPSLHPYARSALWPETERDDRI